MRNSKTIKFILAIILVLVPIMIIPGSDDFFYYPKILMVYVLILFMLGIHTIAQNRNEFRLDKSVLVLIIFISLVMISTIFSNNHIAAIWGKYRREEGLFAIIAYILLFILARIYYKDNKKHSILIGISALIVSVYGISQYFGIDPIPRDEIRLFWSGRAFSTMGNPNFLGTYLVLMLPLPIFQFLKESKYISLLISSIIYLCLLLTFTRSALLGFAVIMGFVLFFVIKKKYLWKKYLVLLLVFFSVTVFVNEESNGRLYGRFFSIGNDAQVLLDREEGYEKAGANRIYIWLRIIDLIKESPWVGYGLENLESVFVEKYSDEMIEMYGKVYLVDRAHNEYLHIAVSSGIPALIAYLIFIFLCLKKGYELTKKDIRYLPYLTAVSAYLVQAFFNISVVSVAYIFWIFLGIITNENVFEEEVLTTLP